MPFAWAKIRNIRLLKRQAAQFHPTLNLVFGDNGAGKTSLLECLQLLGRGPGSPGRGSELLSHGEKQWSVRGGLASSVTGVPEDLVEVRWAPGETRITVNEMPIKLAELARKVPVLAITPYSHRIMEEGPSLRRRYLDWGVFHMEHEFHPAWQRMSRILSQRNAALRRAQDSVQIRVWDTELSATAAKVTAYRQRYVEQLGQALNTGFSELLDNAQWSIRLNPGWRTGRDYAEILSENLARDRRQGFTSEGPHRAELSIRRNERRVQHEISRGQQKLLVSALVLAQCRLFQQASGRFPVLLVDDLGAELSERSRLALCHQLDRYSGQKFVTALEQEGFSGLSSDRRMFHMEQGALTVVQE